MPEDVPKEIRTTPLGEDDEVVVQENVGVDNMQGGGEWPDPDAPSSESAPGPELAGHHTGGKGQFSEVLDEARQEQADS